MTLGGKRYHIISRPLRGPCTLLTSAEQEVASWYCEGETLQRIGARRGCSPRTIANQVHSIFRKLGVSSRAELVRRLTTSDPSETADVG